MSKLYITSTNDYIYYFIKKKSDFNDNDSKFLPVKSKNVISVLILFPTELNDKVYNLLKKSYYCLICFSNGSRCFGILTKEELLDYFKLIGQ
jgi:restriction endonuclease S subunit